MKRKANAAYVRKDPQRWKNLGWTSGPNLMIRDPELSLELVGAWMWLASNTDEFEVSGRVLWESKTGLGRNRAYDLLSELERLGYLLRHRSFDPVAGVPFIQYELQPWPVPEEERTWEPPRAKPKAKRPHPGSKAARTETIPAGQDGFPTGREGAGQDGFPDSRESAPTRTIPTGRESGVDSRRVGSRQAGSPYKEEKITPKEHPSLSPDTDPSMEGRKEDAPQENNPTDAALTLVTGLNFGAHLRPTLAQADELALLVDAAVASGLSLVEVKRHAQAKVNAARSNAVAYLRTGLAAENLPAPMPAAVAPAAPAARGHVPAVSDEVRQSLRTGWRDLAKGSPTV